MDSLTSPPEKWFRFLRNFNLVLKMVVFTWDIDSALMRGVWDNRNRSTHQTPSVRASHVVSATQFD
jgi:hypothetical protein